VEESSGVNNSHKEAQKGQTLGDESGFGSWVHDGLCEETPGNEGEALNLLRA